MADKIDMAAVSLALPRVKKDAVGMAKRIYGASEMAELVRRLDWRGTTLGPISGWSETVVGAVNLVLASPIPATLFWGPELLMIYNDPYRLVMGARHPGGLGRPFAEVWWEAWPVVGRQFTEAFATGSTVQHDAMLVPIEKDGRLQDFYWNYSISPVYEGGEIIGLYNTCTNVTAGVVAGMERDRLAERLQQVLCSTSDGVLTVDRGWRVTYMNEAARVKLAAIPRMVGRELWESLPALAAEGSEQKAHFQDAMTESVPAGFAFYYPEPLDRWFWLRVSPTLEGLAVFFQDITEEKRSRARAAEAAAALAASEEELRWTVELSAQMPWTADVHGGIISSDHRVGGPEGRMIEGSEGDNWHRLIHPEDLEISKTTWAQALATGKPYDVEHRVMTQEGEYRWFRSRARPRRDAEGKIVKWYGTTEDIEVRKQTEEALRTSEKLAVVGRMASSIAHEINNPLEAVTNLLYLARTGEPLSEEVQGYLDAADRELRRASAITSQTLRFHRQASRPTAVALHALVGEVENLLHGKLLNSAVGLELRMRVEKPVRCMEGEIRQVLLNLMDNAIDAMHGQGGGRLMMRTRVGREWSTGRLGVVVTVADTGLGMSAEVCGRAFKPFFTTKGAAGTGLGLWLSQEIAERHGGWMRLRSRQGGGRSGTVFTVFLPEEIREELPRRGDGQGLVERRIGLDRRGQGSGTGIHIGLALSMPASTDECILQG